MVHPIVQKAVQKAVHTKVPAIVLSATLLAGASLAATQLVVPGRAGVVTPAKLSPTAHPPVPNELSAMWLVPSQNAKPAAAMTNFVRGVRLLEEDARPAAALPLLNDGALATTPVADYARYYTGLALMKLDRYAEADRVFSDLASRQLTGHLPEDAAFRLAEIREMQKDYKGAVAVYEGLVAKKLAQPHLAWLRLGLAANLAGLPMRSVEALQRAYYDYPTSAEADRAAEALDKQDVDLDAALAPKELVRAETLFQARRWTAAKASYDRLKPFVTGVDRDRAAIRIAAADIALGRHREGRDALRPYLTGALADEANFHFATATRGLKLNDEHIALAHAFVEKFPTSPFADEILNSLASAYIIDDRDDEADQVFREVLMRYPAGRFAERAAWKTGWSAYRRGQYLDALQYFDKGAAQFPRSDYRPSWLYWSGRAAQQAGDVETGIARLRLTATDYHNSY
ncbi:MAG: tetratricopeptide repeat protein, partial [Vicinamibacterales bacterium]